ncbi:GNAT family N-acetyltransferase [Hymenobacter coccineus]|uniref:GNAT family N-acetyltransferase n=1 Tax=Hymenobacter coccineus TaxID=1908235 RepID=UPI000AA15C73|nr:GNAT family N-acetyltransferase [Hymenobacter coccineus]
MEIRVATAEDAIYADALCQWYIESAKQRGTGIAKREPAYVAQKMASGDGVIAFVDGELAGFCYIETFDDKSFVVNSGLVVNTEIRKHGVGRAIKQAVFNLSRTKYPQAKIFGITTSLAVMKINTDLGYEPVTFSELTQSEDFWKGCKSCKNYGILMENERKMCLCTGMLYDAADQLVQVQVPDFAALGPPPFPGPQTPLPTLKLTLPPK